MDKVIVWGGVCTSGRGAESPPEISCGHEGEVAILLPGVRCIVCDFYCKFGQRLVIFSISHRESASERAFSLVVIHTQCSSISWSTMCMAIFQSGLIAWPLMLPVASAATTASLLQCSLILLALDWVVQVGSACSTPYIPLKLMCFTLCRCGSVVLKCWAGVCMLDRVSPGLRK